MARPFNIDDKVASFAVTLIETSTTAEDVKRALCVALSTEASWNADQIASLLRISRRTVFRYRDEVETIMNGSPNQPRDNWGGRRSGLLSEEEENAFMVEWEERALQGELISVNPIRSALTEIVGHNIPLSTVYRMLYRHNWRKVKPDTRHPKSDSISQEEFKKNWVFADFGSFRPIPKNANHRCNMLINIKNQIYLGNFGGVELNKVESREEIKAILNRLKSNKIS